MSRHIHEERIEARLKLPSECSPQIFLAAQGLAEKQSSRRGLGASGKAAVISPCLQSPYRHCGDVSFGASVRRCNALPCPLPYKYHTFSSYRCISATAAILLYILSTSTKFPHPSYQHCTMRLTVRDTKEQVGNYVSSSLSTLPRSVCRIFRDRY